MLNKIMLQGRLTDTPELKNTPSGVSVTSFSLAVERDFAQNGKKETDFINCVAWRNTAEFICKYFEKGRMLIACGSLQTRSYKAQDGTKRNVWEVVVDSVNFGGDKPKEQADTQTETRYEEPPAHYGYNAPAASQFEEVGAADIDLPF